MKSVLLPAHCLRTGRILAGARVRPLNFLFAAFAVCFVSGCGWQRRGDPAVSPSAEALAAAQAELARSQESWGVRDARTLRAMHALALVYDRIGYTAQANRIWTDLMSLAREAPDFPIYDMLLIACHLANTHAKEDRLAEAEPLYLFALALLEEQRSLTIEQQQDLSRRLLGYVDLLGQLGREEEQRQMRMKIELLLQTRRARPIEPELWREQSEPLKSSDRRQATSDEEEPRVPAGQR